MKPSRMLAMIAVLLALSPACSPAFTTEDGSQRQLRELVDRDQITALVYRLGSILDEGRFDEMGSILSEDATTLTPGGQQVGRDAMIAQAAKIHKNQYRIQHIMSNTLIDLVGDRANIRFNTITNFAPADKAQGPIAPSPQFTIGEVYRLDAKRTPQGWRLSRIQTTPVWETGIRPQT